MFSYQKVGIVTAILVYLLFLFGGFVRATGSGMGCPDWPKCFGLAIPPTCECKLAANYQEIYLQKRLLKVERMAQVLKSIGMPAKAHELLANKAIYKPEKFNVAKAWIEYVNRIVGVLSGLVSVLLLILSFKYIKTKFAVFFWTLIGFILLVFNAWLGSLVVATNLLTGLVSIHFISAFLCLFAFIKALFIQKPWFIGTAKLNYYKSAFFLISFSIVILGVYTREQFEFLGPSAFFENTETVKQELLGLRFQIHQYLPYVALLILIKLIIETGFQQKAKYWFLSLVVLFILQIILGVINIYNGLPVFIQTMHILVGATIPVIAFILLMDSRNEQSKTN